MILLLAKHGESLLKYPFKDRPLTIGRDPTCDIQLADDTVSRVHATLAFKDGGIIVTDHSTNGTFVNDKKITEQQITPKDVVAIGQWCLTMEQEGSPQKTVSYQARPTRILKYTSGHLTVETIEMAAVSPNGKKSRHTVDLPCLVGSAPTSDLIIKDDPYISSRHCRISRDNGSFVLEDLGSTNGTFYKGKRITRELIQPGEFIAGKTRLAFKVKTVDKKIAPLATTSLGPIIGRSRSMREIFALIGQVAGTDATICIMGESGTGKELIARYIHEISPRAAKPFVAINVAAIPANLIESELFGHERGAFTHATATHRGVFEQAHHGTLLLDEIGEMPLDLQTRLLRVMENGVIRRVGGEVDLPIDCRTIAATNTDLKSLVTKGKFREDLFFRLYVIPIGLQPLRERTEDIPLLTEHFLAQFSPRPKRISQEALKSLVKYNWPGNVRELKNTILRAVMLSGADEINEIEFITMPSAKTALLDEQEKITIAATLKETGGNITSAAKRLGISRSTLAIKLKKYGIEI